MPNDDDWFPHWDTMSLYDFRATDEPKWFVDEILAHRWMAQDALELQVRWTLGDVTWEPLSQCKELSALDEYLGYAAPNSPTTFCTRRTSHMININHVQTACICTRPRAEAELQLCSLSTNFGMEPEPDFSSAHYMPILAWSLSHILARSLRANFGAESD